MSVPVAIQVDEDEYEDDEYEDENHGKQHESRRRPFFWHGALKQLAENSLIDGAAADAALFSVSG